MQPYLHIRWLAVFLLAVSCNPGSPIGPIPPTVHTPPPDRGIGLILFSENLEFSDSVATMYILREPSYASDVVATFVRDVTPDGEFRYVVPQLPADASVNAIEYDVNVVGLPFDDTTQQWCRAIYGILQSGAPLKGWTLFSPAFNHTFFWADELPEHNLFFSPEREIAEFFERPDGNTVPFHIGSSYIMYPLQRDRHWLRVHVVTPSNLCEDIPIISTGDFWIQYIDVDGRPLVFYDPHGCPPQPTGGGPPPHRSGIFSTNHGSHETWEYAN